MISCCRIVSSNPRSLPNGAKLFALRPYIHGMSPGKPVFHLMQLSLQPDKNNLIIQFLQPLLALVQSGFGPAQRLVMLIWVPTTRPEPCPWAPDKAMPATKSRPRAIGMAHAKLVFSYMPYAPAAKYCAKSALARARSCGHSHCTQMACKLWLPWASESLAAAPAW